MDGEDIVDDRDDELVTLLLVCGGVDAIGGEIVLCMNEIVKHGLFVCLSMHGMWFVCSATGIPVIVFPVKSIKQFS